MAFEAKWRHEGRMAFTVEEFRDLLRILEERPEWRAELRRLVLTDELLTLPELVRALAEAQQRTEERLATIEDRMASLIVAQQHTEERLAALTAAQQRTEERLSTLAEALEVLIRQVDSLGRSVSLLHDDASKLKGYALETRYRNHAMAYFAPMVRRTHVLDGDELQTLLEEAIERGQLSEAETLDIILADVIIRGRRRADSAEVYLVVEVSWVVDLYDVEHAVRRSSLLSKIGTPTLAVVAGETVLGEAASLANRLHVWQITDGHVASPQDGAPQSP
jgi:hypothetical protein